MRIFALLCLFFGFLFAAMPDYYEGKKVENIEVFTTRNDKKIAIKWIEGSKDENGAIIIALNGGHGKWELKDSHITPSRLGAILAGMKNYRVFSLDMPSDNYGKGDVGGYGNEIYRLSRYQIDDINSVLDNVNKSNAPVYLLTTSKSTISGINAAGGGIKNLKGVILTAISADLTKLASFAQVPTLWIHHKHDKCFDVGIENVKKMALLSPKSFFVEVTNEASVSGKECSMTNYHGFVERDMALAKSIDAWMDGKEVQGVIK